VRLIANLREWDSRILHLAFAETAHCVLLVAAPIVRAAILSLDSMPAVGKLAAQGVRPGAVLPAICAGNTLAAALR
jgi:hypothetical protein